MVATTKGKAKATPASLPTREKGEATAPASTDEMQSEDPDCKQQSNTDSVADEAGLAEPVTIKSVQPPFTSKKTANISSTASSSRPLHSSIKDEQVADPDNASLRASMARTRSLDGRLDTEEKIQAWQMRGARFTEALRAQFGSDAEEWLSQVVDTLLASAKQQSKSHSNPQSEPKPSEKKVEEFNDRLLCLQQSIHEGGYAYIRQDPTFCNVWNDLKEARWRGDGAAFEQLEAEVSDLINGLRSTD